MSQPLVIVESPAKAKTIAGYLGGEFMVESSIGHIRDLPSKAAEIPAAYKKEKWANIGIDVENGFKPIYIVSSRKTDQVKKLKALLKDASELYLATDEDREGEAIAWHLLEVLKPKIPVKRMVFHEITPEAIRRAIDSPRDIDRQLVDAQEARRLLDRLYGYEVSPVLWKKVRPRLSAGRVQSVATRIIVERERERMAFRSANYWDLSATFTATDAKHAEEEPFSAALLELDGQRIATGRDFAQDGTIERDGVLHLNEAQAGELKDQLSGRSGVVESREAKPYRRTPAPPFITSTYQQEASGKLRLSSSQAMRVAQGLYERGFITYMRTDSTTLSESAVAAARSQIGDKFGTEFVPKEPRSYRTKTKNAQEAHEAIRPAGDAFRTPDQVAGELSPPELRVYQMIWQRTLASQMTDATGETVTLKIGVDSTAGQHGVFSTSGTVITHKGFLKVYADSKDEKPDNGNSGDKSESNDKRLPALQEGDAADITELTADGHDTQPPSRYTEASLVKKLEELGVGRPSTYASIMTTVQDRGYVWKKGSAMVPSFLAFAVITLLERHFPDLIDYAFTARMEGDLDNIANGETDVVPWLSQFYFGTEAGPGLREKVAERLGDIDARSVNSIPIGVDSEDLPVVARVGQYGPYLERGRLGGFVSTGGRWQPTASSGQRMRRNAVGVSTGSEVLVFGHRETPEGPLFNEPIDGAAYNPATDSWRDLPACSWVGRPTCAVWTGELMVVLGERGGGAAYDPATDSWRTLPEELTTSIGIRSAVWSGSEVVAFGWGPEGLDAVAFDPDTGQIKHASGVPSKVSDEAVLSWAGTEALLWDKNGGWFYNPATDDWREAPLIGSFDGKKVTAAKAVSVGSAGIYAAAWFRTVSKIRMARLDGAGESAAWTWLPETELDGALAEVHLLSEPGSQSAEKSAEMVIIDDDIPTGAYLFNPSVELLDRFEEFPSRAVRDHIVVSVGQTLVVMGNLVETKGVPHDVTPDELNVTRSIEIMAVPDVVQLGHDPDSGLPVFVRDGKFGPYVQLGEMPKKVTDDNKPRTSSLFQDMKIEEVTLDQALDLLAIPRLLGTDPSDGLEITARNGPHGPYLTKPPAEQGKRGETRSFEDERKLLTITLEDAIKMFAEPKRRAGQRAAAGPLKELGVDPTTDLPVEVRNGQFGEYVTDGEVNASLTVNDSVDRIDITRASELLAGRRAKMAANGDAPAKKATKKAGKKPAKKSVKKTSKRAAAKRR